MNLWHAWMAKKKAAEIRIIKVLPLDFTMGENTALAVY